MRKLFVMGMVLMMLLTACNSAKQLTIEDHGSHVRLMDGDTLQVTLEANRKADYDWTIYEIDNVILQQMGETEYIEKGVITPGSCCDAIFTFEAVGVGETGLVLGYHKPDEVPENTFVITVIVE